MNTCIISFFLCIVLAYEKLIDSICWQNVEKAKLIKMTKYKKYILFIPNGTEQLYNLIKPRKSSISNVWQKKKKRKLHKVCGIFSEFNYQRSY